MNGLINNGNTCYLNAGLQMLLQNKDLLKLMKKYTQSNIINKIYDFFNTYNNSNNITHNPLIIKKVIEIINPFFKGNEQHDSSEFIIFFLNLINDEILKQNKESKEMELLNNIELNVRIKCKYRKCLNINNNTETSNFLFLDLNGSDLDELYLNFKSSSKLEGDNMYLCEKCNDKSVASKRYNIIKWPTHLLILLKRFIHNNNNFYKNNDNIKIPLLWRNYILKGFIYHMGSLHGGHYIYIKNYNDKWYILDDENIIEINNIDNLNKLLEKAYILYYERI